MYAAVLEKLEKVFALLSVPLYLLDQKGRCLVPPQPETFILPEYLKEDVPSLKNGYLFLALPGFEGQALATKDREGARDILLMAFQMVQSTLMLEGITSDANNALGRMLRGELRETETEALIADQKIDKTIPRAVLLISFPHVRGQTAREILFDALPMDDDDLLIGLDAATAALARDMRNGSAADLSEYAMALLDTLQNELGLLCRVGIGEAAATVYELPTSFAQARKALEIGRVYRPQELVYDFRGLILERFMADIPAQTAEDYASLLFNRKTARLFSEEMLETVDVFIQKDLNLSDAARQLYIHRNTLVYRLDKIQRLSGLDLRHFHDAMTFKLLFDFKKYAKIKGKPSI